MAFTVGNATFTQGSTTVTGVSLDRGTLSYFSNGTRVVVGRNPVIAEVGAVKAPTTNTIELEEPWPLASGSYPFLANMTSEGIRDAVQVMRLTNDNIVSANAALTAVAKIYPTVADGQAATSVGEYFSVVGTGEVFASLYENQGASSVKLSDLLNADAIVSYSQTAQTSATQAQTSETNAAASESAAATSAFNAATSETNAANSASAASASETAAATSETNAATSESAAATSASNAATSETNAANSASAAASSESNAALSETNAANSASAAASSESNASLSETNAANSASAAATSETNAAASETNAANSASAAATSETNAASSASAAATSETNAAASETAAATSASNAATSETNAADSEFNAGVSEANAAASETNAAADALLAQKWSSEDEDIEVTAGKYSSYHYSQKAADSAAAAQQAAQTVTGGMFFAGSHDASTGQPPIAPTEGSAYYKISVAGVINTVDYNPGDQIVYDNINDVWFKVDGSDRVDSVNGQIGTIVLDLGDFASTGTAAYNDTYSSTGNLIAHGTSADQVRDNSELDLRYAPIAEGGSNIAGTGLTWSGGNLNVDNPFNPSGDYANLRARATTAADVGAYALGSKVADSELLDGANGTQYLRSDINDAMNGNITFNGSVVISDSADFIDFANNGTQANGIRWDDKHYIGGRYSAGDLLFASSAIPQTGSDSWTHDGSTNPATVFYLDANTGRLFIRSNPSPTNGTFDSVFGTTDYEIYTEANKPFWDDINNKPATATRWATPYEIVEQAIELNSTDNINNLTGVNDQGIYKWSGSAPTGAPSTYMVMFAIHDGSQMIHMAFGSAGTGRAEIRRNNSGTWSDWGNETAWGDLTGIPATASRWPNFSEVTGTLDDARIEPHWDSLHPEARHGIFGGYGQNAGSGSDWGADIWCMGYSYSGNASGTGYVKGNNYGISWLRGAHPNRNTFAGEGLYVFRAGGIEAALGSDGVYFASEARAASFQINSDRRLKNNLVALTSTTKFSTYSWDWSDKEQVSEKLHGKHDIGLVAQEVEEVYPELVTTDDDGYKSVDYGKFGSINSVENTARIERLEQRIFELENQSIWSLIKRKIKGWLV